MPFNGSGGFDPLSPPTYPAVAGEVIFASRFNSIINDVLSGLGSVITRNGQSPATANLPMGGFKHTGAGDASATGQYLVYGQTTAATLGGTLTAASFIPTSATIPTNGLYLKAANNLAMASNSTLRWDVSSAGNHVIAPPSSGVTFTLPAPTGGGANLSLTGVAATTLQFIAVGGSTTGAIYGDLINTSGYMRIGIESSTGSVLFNGTAAYASVLGTENNTALVLATNAAARLTISGSGNVAIAAPSSGHHTVNVGSGNSGSFEVVNATNAVIAVSDGAGNNRGLLNWTGGNLALVNTNNGLLQLGTNNDVNMLQATSAGSWSFKAPSSGDTANFGQLSGSRAIITDVSLSGGTAQWSLANASNTANSDARIQLQSAGTSAGDPYIYMTIPGATNWSFGVDNSDVDAFIIASSSVLGTNNRFRIPTAGAASILSGVYTPTSSQAFTATPTFDASLSNVFEFSGTLTANVTAVTLTNPLGGQTIQIRVKQDATGGRTFATPSGAKIAGSIATTASVASILTLTYSAMDSRWEGAWVQLPV